MHHHEGRPCDGSVWEPEPRCTRTAHRIARDGTEPRETRSLPWPLWLFEIAARGEALLRGRLARNGRL